MVLLSNLHGVLVIFKGKAKSVVHKGYGVGKVVDVLLQVTELVSQVPKLRVELL